MTGASLPEGRRGQALAVAIAVLAVALLWIGIASPLIGWYADRADNLLRQSMLERRMAALVATLPALRRQASAAPADAAARPDLLLQADSDATAGAALQQRIQDMAAKAGVSLAAIETLPTQQAGALRRIALRVTATTPWAPLVHLLQAIEQANPAMSIDDLQLHATLDLARPNDLPIGASFAIAAFRAEPPK
jgi:general secretion pathway protein M